MTLISYTFAQLHTRRIPSQAALLHVHSNTVQTLAWVGKVRTAVSYTVHAIAHRRHNPKRHNLLTTMGNAACGSERHRQYACRALWHANRGQGRMRSHVRAVNIYGGQIILEGGLVSRQEIDGA